MPASGRRQNRGCRNNFIPGVPFQKRELPTGGMVHRYRAGQVFFERFKVGLVEDDAGQVR